MSNARADRRTYRWGLASIIVVSVCALPLAALSLIPSWIGIALFVVLAGWISVVGTRAFRSPTGAPRR